MGYSIQNAWVNINSYYRSRNAYAMYLRLQYLLARTFYYNNSFDLLKMTKDDESSEIQVRWMVQGTPRFIPWRLSQKYRFNSISSYYAFIYCFRVLLNGFSTFVINNRGKISLHKLDRVSICNYVQCVYMSLCIS